MTAPHADPTHFTLSPRFNGPPTTANGGYACGYFAGLAAAAHGPDVSVTLLAPPPLGPGLVLRPGRRRSQVLHGERLIATVAPGSGGFDAPGPVGTGAAAEAATRFTGTVGHPFPTCFVCGTDRAPGDGLRLTPGPVADRPDTVACVWTPDESVTGPGGDVPLPVVWAVLDCPGGWCGDPAREPMVLSRMTARVGRRPEPGRPYVVTARRLRRSGRTAVHATALYDARGDLLAEASAVWAAVAPASTA
ncbi:hypothetical protein SRB5_29870 [Streptomyces sp. RB5]|uniref:Thioesterase superfamily protein n=1 Tax=Streptomyces smaragdinus TaxID=2585196 RepID=A0A7K0CHB0_9ACTN|nr:hypothetical protein [Streptomyces smaragdinus]MQY12848.1 hypothetical protein [Streptomyces smaragdinus]